MRRFAIFLLFLSTAIAANSQDEVSRTNLGIGFGLDYGGIGGRFTVLPDSHFGLFAGAGYNFGGLGYNLGAQWRILPDKRAVPVIGFMYGYNAVLQVTDLYTNTTMTTTYYGTSLSLGVELHSEGRPKNFFNLELVIPFRSQEFTDYYNYLKSIGASTTYSPVAFSVGYHFGF